MTILANRQLAITRTDIFTVSGADVLDTESVTVNKIAVFNKSATTQIAILYLKDPGGNVIKLRRFELLKNEGGEYLEPGETITLENGDVLQAETTTTDAVDFVVFGTRI